MQATTTLKMCGAAALMALGIGAAVPARADSCGLDCGPKAMSGQHYTVKNGEVVPDAGTVATQSSNGGSATTAQTSSTTGSNEQPARTTTPSSAPNR